MLFNFPYCRKFTNYTNFLRPFHSRSASPKNSWGLASCHGNLSGGRSGEYSQHATLSVACTGDHDYCGLWRLLPHIFGRREGRERGRTRKTKKKREISTCSDGGSPHIWSNWMGSNTVLLPNALFGFLEILEGHSHDPNVTMRKEQESLVSGSTCELHIEMQLCLPHLFYCQHAFGPP